MAGLNVALSDSECDQRKTNASKFNIFQLNFRRRRLIFRTELPKIKRKEKHLIQFTPFFRFFYRDIHSLKNKVFT